MDTWFVVMSAVCGSVLFHSYKKVRIIHFEIYLREPLEELAGRQWKNPDFFVAHFVFTKICFQICFQLGSNRRSQFQRLVWCYQ